MAVAFETRSAFAGSLMPKPSLRRVHQSAPATSAMASNENAAVIGRLREAVVGEDGRSGIETSASSHLSTCASGTGATGTGVGLGAGVAIAVFAFTFTAGGGS